MAESSGNDISQTSLFIVQISAESSVNGMGLAVMIFSVVRFVSLFVFLAEFKEKEMELASHDYFSRPSPVAVQIMVETIVKDLRLAF